MIIYIMFNDKTILVTGGAGFIGSHIVQYLYENTYVKMIKIIDNLSTGNIKNISQFLDDPKIDFIKGDICNIDTLRHIMKDVDMVCHQAAIGSVPRSLKSPLDYHNTNVTGFFNILEVAREYGIKRIVYASSSSVYGDHPVLPKKENNIGSQLSPYAITKYIDELYAGIYHKCYGIETIGLRYFNVFGPRQNPDGPYAAVIPIFIKKSLLDEYPIIYGNGEQSRDFTYVSNVVDANIAALLCTNSNVYGNIFNIGCGNSITLNNFVNMLSTCIGRYINPQYKTDRNGDIKHSHADISRAQLLLNYKPSVDFLTGLKKTISYYNNNAY